MPESYKRNRAETVVTIDRAGGKDSFIAKPNPVTVRPDAILTWKAVGIAVDVLLEPPERMGVIPFKALAIPAGEQGSIGISVLVKPKTVEYRIRRNDTDEWVLGEDGKPPTLIVTE